MAPGVSHGTMFRKLFFDAVSVKKVFCEVSDASGQSGGALLTAPHGDAGG